MSQAQVPGQVVAEISDWQGRLLLLELNHLSHERYPARLEALHKLEQALHTGSGLSLTAAETAAVIRGLEALRLKRHGLPPPLERLRSSLRHREQAT